jgi:hypothetical protein
LLINCKKYNKLDILLKLIVIVQFIIVIVIVIIMNKHVRITLIYDHINNFQNDYIELFENNSDHYNTIDNERSIQNYNIYEDPKIILDKKNSEVGATINNIFSDNNYTPALPHMNYCIEFHDINSINMNMNLYMNIDTEITEYY